MTTLIVTRGVIEVSLMQYLSQGSTLFGKGNLGVEVAPMTTAPTMNELSSALSLAVCSTAGPTFFGLAATDLPSSPVVAWTIRVVHPG